MCEQLYRDPQYRFASRKMTCTHLFHSEGEIIEFDSILNRFEIISAPFDLMYLIFIRFNNLIFRSRNAFLEITL